MRRFLSNLSRRIRRPGTGERRFRVIAATTVLVGVLITSPAWADPGLSWMGSAFDIKDSAGIKLSQYELSMDDGGKIHPIRGVWFSVIQFAWSTHTSIVGILGALLDWTVSLTWVPWIAGPLGDIQKLIRNQLLAPMGATAWGGRILVLLLLVAASIAGIKIMRGRTSGWWDLIRGATAAALAVGFFAAPVTGIVGDGTHLAEPLAAAQRIGTGLSTMITDGGKPQATVGGNKQVTVDSQGHPKFTTGQDTAVSSMLVESFVRPLHQQLNYGSVIDGTKCEATYNKALKAGPHGGDAEDQRKALKDCDKKYGDYTDTAATASWLVGFNYFEIGMGFMAILLLIFTGVIWYYMAKLMWSALASMIDILKAIPGHTEPLLRDIASICAALAFYVSGLAVLSIILKIIAMIFSSGGQLAVKFLIVDVVVIIGAIFFIVHLVRTHRGEQKLRDRFKSWLHAPDRAASVAGTAARRLGSTAGRNLKRAAVRRMTGNRTTMGQSLGRDQTGTDSAFERPGVARRPGTDMARPQPRRGRRAALGALTVLTGGAGAAAGKATSLARAYRVMRAGGGITPGHHRATNIGMAVTARAHNYLDDRRQAAATIEDQARHGRKVRATTGSKRLDAAARTTGRMAAQLDTATLETRVKAARAGHKVAERTRTLTRPATARAQVARKAMSQASQTARQKTRKELADARAWSRTITDPLAALTAPPTRIGPQPPPQETPKPTHRPRTRNQHTKKPMATRSR
ncbi:hypothetical protein [Acidipropionibacterium acidipropionici]|uniref:Uncharacterized protein n=1 Tax=Acidipropionibacterium acidipropionici TaxID=1748 RepID=A0AAC9AML2_9ACTN|nr:hypothetical protein [Acidipropionibacterium acidipropionici]AMS04120.1 hypothetical protein AXH35_00110 [Acidipropionibacterium acidipropionici]